MFVSILVWWVVINDLFMSLEASMSGPRVGRDLAERGCCVVAVFRECCGFKAGLFRLL